MREGWEEKSLGEVCYVFNGYAFKSKDSIEKSSTQLLRMGNLYRNILDLNRKPVFYPDIFSKKYKDFVLKEGDLIMSLTGTVDKTDYGYTVKVPLTEVDLLLNQRIMKIEVHNSKALDRDYLFKFLLSPMFLSKLYETASGTRQANLSSRTILTLKILYPKCLQEQKQIVALLDKAFEAIDQAKANIEKNIENAKELFQSKLNEIFSQKGDGWEEKSLGEVTELYQGLAINKKTKHLLVETSTLPLIRIKDLKNNTEEQFVKETGYPEKAKVGVDDIIYTRTGSLGLVFRGKIGILHNNSFKVVPSDELSKDYLFWWLQHDAFTKIIIGLASRAAQPDITHKLFKQQIISIPTKEMQAKYYELIENLNSTTINIIKAYSDKLKNLEELKKSILQKAFAGELTNKTVEI